VVDLSSLCWGVRGMKGRGARPEGPRAGVGFLGGLRERRKLPQLGPGQSLG